VKGIKLSLIMLLFATLLFSAGKINLSDPDDYYTAFLKARADLTGKEVVFYWTGTVYSFVPGEADKPLFKFEGYNIAKLVKVEGGYEMLTREAAFYEDLKTGQIIEKWNNPWLNKEVKVIQIWNDPVNQSFVFPEQYKPYMTKLLPSTDLGKMMSFNLDLFLNYPSPLKRAEYPLNAQSDTYEAAELFRFFVDKKDLENKKLSSAPVSISWTRFSPWMPFMEMGDKPGNLVFSCSGYKLENGFNDLPEHLKKYVNENKPVFSKAPDTFTEPNETSWTYFLKYMKDQEVNQTK